MKTKTTKTIAKGNCLGVKINLAIFLVFSILCAFVFPNLVFRLTVPEVDAPEYAGESAVYSVLYDICPCSAKENYNYDACSGYHACGADKANLPYDFDNAPEDLLKAAKRDAYFDYELDTVRHQIVGVRTALLMDLCYVLSGISLLSGIIYEIHNISRE